MTKMKDSGIEWIGQIPEDWEVIKFKQSIIEINDKNNPVRVTNVLSLTKDKGVLPYEEKGNQGNRAKEDLSQYKIAYKDTIVANSMNIIIGSVGISNYEGCVSPVYYVFKNKDNANLRYLNYLLTTTEFQKQLRRFANGILEIRLRISSENLMAQRIPFPSLAQQIKISDFLDRKVSEIDKTIADTKATIEDYKKYKQTVITETVTKGLDYTVPMKNSGIKWFLEIPQEWSVIKLGRIISVKSNLVHPEKYSDYIQVSPENIEKGNMKLLPCKTVADMGIVSDNHLFYKGQVLYSKVRPKLNKVCIAPFDGLCSADMYPIETEQNAKYIAYLFLSNIFVEQVVMITEDRVKMPKINQDELSTICVPLPYNNLDEQERIVSYLDSVCEEIDGLIVSKETLVTDLEVYKKSVIYEYVTGKKQFDGARDER